jgi:serpin B
MEVQAPVARSEVKMIDGEANFAAALHGKLRAIPANAFYSPACVRIALAMAAAGARGATSAEMRRALSLPEGEAQHAAVAGQLAAWASLADAPLPRATSSDPRMRKLQEEEREQRRVVLRVVNRLWTQSGHELRADFVKLLQNRYRAPLGAVDFGQDAARVAINQWVSDATEQRIEDLIKDPLPGDTKLVITNAVYFKARWSEQFKKSATQDQPFFAAGGNQSTVRLMRRVDHLPLARLEGAMMAELSYGDGSLAMDVVLPDARDGLGRIEDAYASGAFRDWVAALSPTRVDLMLPRFRVSSTFELARTLSGLGMPSAFKYPDADFSGIDGSRDLYIGRVVHEAFVDVDEHGTEAAAATVAMMRLGMAPPSVKPVVFRADHPFLFFIRDTQSGSVLFAGRLVDPSSR